MALHWCEKLQHHAQTEDNVEIFSPVFSFSGSHYCRVTSLRTGGRRKSSFGRLQNVHHYWCFSLAYSDLNFVCLSKIVSTELANSSSKFYQNYGYHGDMCNGGKIGFRIRSSLPVFTFKPLLRISHPSFNLGFMRSAAAAC